MRSINLTGCWLASEGVNKARLLSQNSEPEQRILSLLGYYVYII